MYIEIKEPLKAPEPETEGFKENSLYWIIGACFLGNTLFLISSILFAGVSESGNSKMEAQRPTVTPAAAPSPPIQAEDEVEGEENEMAMENLAAEDEEAPGGSRLDQITEANFTSASPFLVNHRKKVKWINSSAAICSSSLPVDQSLPELEMDSLSQPDENEENNPGEE